MYDLIIIGGGPAGLTAMLYAIRKQIDALLISPDLGGKTNYHMTWHTWDDIQHAVRGVDIVNDLRRELESLDFAHRLEPVVSVEKNDDEIFIVSLPSGETLSAQSVIVATGSSVQQLNVPGEKELVGHGVSYSAVSYAPFMEGKKATVVGDGMLAVRAVAELSPVAEEIYLVAPTPGELDAPVAKRLISRQKVKVFESYQVTAIEGDGFVNRVVLDAPDGQQTEIDTDTVFIQLGLVPNIGFVKCLVTVDGKDQIMVDNAARTSCLGLFAAGDVTNAYGEQVLVAIGEGAKAALSAAEYLSFRKALEQEL